ncbi:uncharacterized protein LOC107615421 [Arachis ipaensis]|uniref:At2g35280-like TPR domain-containing protein n=1 Tax=Arachis hypogaea TaxID=3818 RepID=A0A444XL07_ARAHY|nr:uncharacterized protein LOC107615421 [Arachis ipaensis]RYQ90358.1 hypothetical protein Ahy_B09g096481 [Arachis hypogaea]
MRRMKMGATSTKGKMDKKAKNGRRKGKGVPPRDCPLSLLPHDIWVRIAARVALASIQDLFNMQATCKVFLDAARSSAVYMVASVAELPIAVGTHYDERPERGFLYSCANAGNSATMFCTGMMEFFWIGRYVGGMNTLIDATNTGNFHARYMCVMLLLTPSVGHEEYVGRVLRCIPTYRLLKKSKCADNCLGSCSQIRWLR